MSTRSPSNTEAPAPSDVVPRCSQTRLAHREDVEQRLAGVLVPAVAGVHDPRVAQPPGDLRGRAGRLVAHHDHVRAEGLDGLDGVAQALALLHRARR